jgi:adenylate kinase
VCGGQLSQRSDDREETVRRRLGVYREQTAPLLEYYAEGETGLTAVDGTGDIELITGRLFRALDEVGTGTSA